MRKSVPGRGQTQNLLVRRNEKKFEKQYLFVDPCIVDTDVNVRWTLAQSTLMIYVTWILI